MNILKGVRRKPEKSCEPVAWVTLEHRFTIYHARGAARGSSTAHGPEKGVYDDYGGYQPSAHDLITNKLLHFKDEVMREGFCNGAEWISPYSVHSIVFAEESEVVAD